jgi:hypothetical protein
MTPERLQKIKQLYQDQAAREREEGDRAAYLQQACASDDGLRQEVESPLAQGSATGSFLEGHAVEVAAKAIAEQKPTPWHIATHPDETASFAGCGNCANERPGCHSHSTLDPNSVSLEVC